MRLAGPADTGNDVPVYGIYLYLAPRSVPSNTQVATAKPICGTQAFASTVFRCSDSSCHGPWRQQAVSADAGRGLVQIAGPRPVAQLPLKLEGPGPPTTAHPFLSGSIS